MKLDIGMHEGVFPDSDIILYWPTGSYYICNPPVTDTDIDHLLLVKNKELYACALAGNDWSLCGSKVKGSNFYSYRKDKHNLIITDNRTWFFKFAAATELARTLNLLKKEERVEFFDLILDGK